MGSAKRQVMGAGRSPNSTYAAAIKLMKRPNSSMASGRGHPKPTQTTAKPPQTTAKPPQTAAKPPQAPSKPQQSAGQSCRPKQAPQPSDERVPESGTVSSSEADMDMDCESVPTPKPKTKKNETSDRKRARPTSPKTKYSGIPVSNQFSPLEETPLTKKQAILEKNTTVEKTSDPVTLQPRGQRSRSAENSRSRTAEARASEDSCSPKPIVGKSSKIDTTIPVKP